MRLQVVFFFLILIHSSSLNLPSEDGEMYQQLSPGAFFSMKDNEAMGNIMGFMGPAGPGMGPMRPGMGAASPLMGPVGPGMRPVGPGMNPGMGPKKPESPLMGPMGPIGPMKPGITDTRDGKKGYEYFDLSILDNIARQSQYTENFGVQPILHGKGDAYKYVLRLIYNLCFCLSYIWRRGRLSIRKYYHLRDIYSNHLAFEVGYITHVIMAKYQNMLELFEYCNSKMPKKVRGKLQDPHITRMHLTHFQHSIEQDSQQIEHLCNMLNELKKKYEVQPYDPRNKFDIPPEGWGVETPDTPNSTITTENEAPQDGQQPKLQGRARHIQPKQKAYIAQKLEETHKLIDDALANKKRKLQNAREYFKKYGHYPTTTSPRTQQPMRLWSPNLDYGWSGEDEW